MTGEWLSASLPARPDQPVDFDTSVAHIARVYDYWLGGKDNFAADREAGEEALQAYPDLVSSVRADRAFLARGVRYLAAEAGIRQFLDIGTGIPTANNTHEVAQSVAPGSRVVYVDNDPIVGPPTTWMPICARPSRSWTMPAPGSTSPSRSRSCSIAVLHLIGPEDNDPHARSSARLLAAVPLRQLPGDRASRRPTSKPDDDGRHGQAPQPACWRSRARCRSRAAGHRGFFAGLMTWSSPASPRSSTGARTPRWKGPAGPPCGAASATSPADRPPQATPAAMTHCTAGIRAAPGTGRSVAWRRVPGGRMTVLRGGGPGIQTGPGGLVTRVAPRGRTAFLHRDGSTMHRPGMIVAPRPEPRGPGPGRRGPRPAAGPRTVRAPRCTDLASPGPRRRRRAPTPASPRAGRGSGRPARTRPGLPAPDHPGRADRAPDAGQARGLGAGAGRMRPGYHPPRFRPRPRARPRPGPPRSAGTWPVRAPVRRPRRPSGRARPATECCRPPR